MMQVPSTSPDVSLPTDESASSSKRVLLYRDTNAWCPFCERVWLALLEKGVAYDTVFIDLRDKPDWYKAMIPTAQVPAAYIDGELVWESAKILEKFEAAFPEPPLMPTEAAERAHVDTVVQEFEATEGVGAAGYRFLRGAPFGEPVNEEKVPEMRVSFEAKLRELEVGGTPALGHIGYRSF
jgi:glutathione S-transferase